MQRSCYSLHPAAHTHMHTHRHTLIHRHTHSYQEYIYTTTWMPMPIALTHTHMHTVTCTHQPRAHHAHTRPVHKHGGMRPPTAVSVLPRVYRPELPGAAEAVLLRGREPLGGCRNLLSPRPLSDSPFCHGAIMLFLSGALSDCGKKIAFSDQDLRNTFPENSAQIN